MLTENLLDRINSDGYAIVPNVVTGEVVRRLLDAIEAVAENSSVRKRRDSVFAIRNLLDCVPEVSALARSEAMSALVASVLGDGYRPVRAILFDKTADANWNVFWHQDLSIAVQSRKDAEGFGPWTVKSGVQHVQPPAAIMEEMITVRLHLDNCHEANGPVQVIPGSHRHGRMDAETLRIWRDSHTPAICTAGAGDALLMRPLLLHASSSATSADHRRVVHIEIRRLGSSLWIALVYGQR